MIIANAPPAHAQNNGDNPASIVGRNTPTKLNPIIAMRTNPINSRLLAIFYLIEYLQGQKDILFCYLG